MKIAMKYGASGNAAGSNAQQSTMRLLWTNSDPTASFAAQSISVDLSSYSWFAVKFRFSTTIQQDSPLAFFSADDTPKRLDIVATGNNRTGGRSVTYSTTDKTLTFSAASYNGAANNANAIPVEIYGINW